MTSKVSTPGSAYSGRAGSSSTCSLIAWGELVWDVLPSGALRLGGGAGNFARQARLAGAQAALVAAVGGDDDDADWVDALRQTGLDPELVTRVPGASTGRVRISLLAGEPHYELERQGPRVSPPPTPALERALTSANALRFGLLEQRLLADLSALEHAIEQLPAGAHRLCDLNVRPRLATRAEVERALALASVIKLNEREAQTLCELFGTSDAIALLLARPSIELVALTRGARGSVLATREARVDHPGFPSRGDAVGAGDAFSARLLIELCAGSTLAGVAERANRYAARAVSSGAAT